jgi:hypothetical protein
MNIVVMRERIRDWFHHSPHNNGQSQINKENSYDAWYMAHLTRVIKKSPLNNKYNPSSVGTNRPHNH